MKEKGKKQLRPSVEMLMEGGETIPTQNVSFSNENYIWLIERTEILKTSFSRVVNEYITEARAFRSKHPNVKIQPAAIAAKNLGKVERSLSKLVKK